MQGSINGNFLDFLFWMECQNSFEHVSFFNYQPMGGKMVQTVLGKLTLEKLGDRLRIVDRFLLDILKIRLGKGGLSDYVSENKRRSSKEGIYSKLRLDVEDKRIESAKNWANELGINRNFAAMLQYNIISESCRVQDEYMFNKFIEHAQILKNEDEEEVADHLRKNLLILTNKVAEKYDEQYSSDYLGTKLHFSFSRSLIMSLISELNEKGLAVDLGCATGKIAFLLAPNFKKVIGYDVSPDMMRVANSKRSDYSNVEFYEFDLENGLELPENSISLAVMNLGTTSDIKNIEKLLTSLKRCLTPEGKFLLSFYNSESLVSTFNFIPWPIQTAASFDFDKNCLEVFFENEIFYLYAKPRNVEEIKVLLKDFRIDDIFSHPTIASIIPRILIEHEDKDGNKVINEKAISKIKEIDKILTNNKVFSGSYLIVTGGK